MAQNRFRPTDKDSLTVHGANFGEGLVVKESLITQQKDFAGVSVVKNSFTAAVRQKPSYFEQTIAANVAEIQET